MTFVSPSHYAHIVLQYSKLRIFSDLHLYFCVLKMMSFQLPAYGMEL